MSLATPFAFDSKAVLAQDLPGNHRGGRSRFFGEGFLLEGCPGGICSTRIDFQLGTNAADTNGLNWLREVYSQKNLQCSLGFVVHRQLGDAWELPRNHPESDRWSSSFSPAQATWDAGLAGVIPGNRRKMRRKSTAI
jgi:hypothetical protein